MVQWGASTAYQWLLLGLICCRITAILLLNLLRRLLARSKTVVTNLLLRSTLHGERIIRILLEVGMSPWLHIFHAWRRCLHLMSICSSSTTFSSCSLLYHSKSPLRVTPASLTLTHHLTTSPPTTMFQSPLYPVRLLRRPFNLTLFTTAINPRMQRTGLLATLSTCCWLRILSILLSSCLILLVGVSRVVWVSLILTYKFVNSLGSCLSFPLISLTIGRSVYGRILLRTLVLSHGTRLVKRARRRRNVLL